MLHIVNKNRPFQATERRRNALVSIVMGDRYTKTWEAVVKQTWINYAERFGYDIVVVTDNFDDSERGRSRSPSWQKLLMLGQPWAALYERVVWIDADIVISRNAPNILDSATDSTKIGLCAFGAQMSLAEKHIYFERLYSMTVPPQNAEMAWKIIHQNGFKGHGWDTANAPMFNCGLFVVTPSLHRELLSSVYQEEEGAKRLYEQPNLSYRIHKNDLAQVLTPRFNWSVHEFYMLNFPRGDAWADHFDHLIFQLRNELEKVYFLHFCGTMEMLNIIADMMPTRGDVLGAFTPAWGGVVAHHDVTTPAPEGDYISPGLARVFPDQHFPNMIIGDPKAVTWPFLRPNSPHNWYVDKRAPKIGFLSRDEAHLIYNTALQAKGMPALEIGCFLGWSACHLALAGVDLDIVDPILANDDFAESVTDSLRGAGVLERCNLVKSPSPGVVDDLVAGTGKRWNLIFIDGNHEGDGPVLDAEVCAKYAADDCIVLFHDLYAPAVAAGLRWYKERGWQTRIYNTSQVVGVAWRGAMKPVEHTADPRLGATLPAHLNDLL